MKKTKGEYDIIHTKFFCAFIIQLCVDKLEGNDELQKEINMVIY